MVAGSVTNQAAIILRAHPSARSCDDEQDPAPMMDGDDLRGNWCAKSGHNLNWVNGRTCVFGDKAITGELTIANGTHNATAAIGVLVP